MCNNYPNRLNKFLIICLLFLSSFTILSAQVNLTIQVNSTTVGTNCDDGSVFGVPLDIEPVISVNFAGQDNNYYGAADCPFYMKTAPYTQYSETFNCSSAYPSNIQTCIRVYEEDGPCASSTQCLEQLCDDFSTPAVGTSITYTLFILNDGINNSWGEVNFTITASGSFNEAPNDLICNAIDLGTLNNGALLGDTSLSLYHNLCATNSGEPNSWAGTNEQGVWFTFSTGTEASSYVEFYATSDPQNIGNEIDLQLALYETSDNTCSGALTLVQEEYNDPISVFDEQMNVNCLKPNTNYYLLIDGEAQATFNPNGNEGYFGLHIKDNGVFQASDQICDASNLGIIPDNGSVSTGTLNQSNICATNLNDPTPFGTSQNGVWYQFIAPNSTGVVITAKSDLPYPLGQDAIDIQLSLFETDDNLCSGSLTLIDSSYSSGGTFDEELEVTCLTPGKSYWLMVDGSSLNPTGIFDISIADIEIYTAGDYIFEALDLGLVPDLGTVSTPALSQTNECASNLFDPIPFGTTQKAVWYQFQAPTSGHVVIEAHSGNELFEESIDLQLALYATADNTSTGSLILIDQLNDDLSNDVSITVPCLNPGQNYWIMLDGSPLDATGIFDISISDEGTPITPSNSVDVKTTCDSLTWMNGVTYTSSNNTATFIEINDAGCDSIITLNLTVNYSSTKTDLITACRNHTWIDGNVYTSSTNTPTYTITNTQGCDSIITLDLVILDPLATVSTSGTTLTADQTGSYQWLDCNDNYAEINGAVDQYYTPDTPGNYAVEISNNNCADTSECTEIALSIYKHEFGNMFSLYPNPTNGALSIDLGNNYHNIQISIFNLKGKKVLEQSVDEAQTIYIDIRDVANGEYLLSLQTKEGINGSFKIIKE